MLRPSLDRYVTLLCAAALLSFAASCGTADQPKAEVPTTPQPAVSEIIFSGSLTGIEVVPGKGESLSEVKDGQAPAVALSSTGGKREPDGDGNSGIIRLTPTLSSALNGRKVTVNITLRQAPQNGSPVARAMYSRPGVATSGWRDLPLASDFAKASFEYDVPSQPGTRGPDLVSIWADPEGNGRTVEVRSVEIKAPAIP